MPEVFVNATNNEVFMNTDGVEQISKDFDQFGDTLDSVARTLEMIANVLKVSAWLGFGATTAATACVDQIVPLVKGAAKDLHGLAGDIMGAVKAIRDGDMSGSQRFV